MLELGFFTTPRTTIGPEGPSNDYSWLLIAVTRNKDAYVIDAAQGFLDTDMLINGDHCEDNGICVPTHAEKGIYKVVDIRISGGEKDEWNGDYYDIEIDGHWMKLKTDLLKSKNYELI